MPIAVSLLRAARAPKWLEARSHVTGVRELPALVAIILPGPVTGHLGPDIVLFAPTWREASRGDQEDRQMVLFGTPTRRDVASPYTEVPRVLHEAGWSGGES